MAESNPYNRDGDDTEDEEELDETVYKAQKDALLLLIDVSRSMLQPTAPPTDPPPKGFDSSPPAIAALKCAYALMQQRIISNPNDLMGIILYGTQETKFLDDDDQSYPHCYLLTDLDIPAAGDVKSLRTLIDDEEDEEARRILKPCAGKEGPNMGNILFCANQIFTTKAPNFSSRRLFIVTDEDDPCGVDKQLKQQASVRAKDLYDLGVMIELFPIERDGRFNRAKFYDDIIYSPLPTDPSAPLPLTQPPTSTSPTSGIPLLTSLLTSISSRSTPKRALFSNLPLEIGPGFTISVKGYILHKPQLPKRSCYIALDTPTGPQIAKGISQTLDANTSRPIGEKKEFELKKAFKFGGSQILFTPEEVKSLRHFTDPVIRILGFKSLSKLPFWANLKPATFIYPSEETFVGSTRVFAALHAKLLSSQRFALAWFVPRKNTVPTLAAIYASPDHTSPSSSSESPPPTTTTEQPPHPPSGLFISPLPFADDLRQSPETTLIRAPDRLVDLMRDIIQQLQLPGAIYSPSRYPNPSLQWHYRILQALALEEDLPEKPEDRTRPKYKQIDKRAGPYVMDWGEELHERSKEWEAVNGSLYSTTTVPAKRGAPPATAASDRSGGGGIPDRPLAKKSKTTPSAGDDATITSDDTMRKAFEKNAISKLTVSELKAWLAGKKMGVGGKKQDLVERVEGYWEMK